MSKGKQYGLFVPTSTETLETTKIYDILTNHFDQVIVSTKDDCDLEHSNNCKKGLEITAIRDKNEGNQEFIDALLLLKLISPVSRADRVMLKTSSATTMRR
jgi:hypothetical protein